MDILIKRNQITHETIDGEVFIDGFKVCDCAENAVHSIIRGTYSIKLQKCKFRARKMPCIVLRESIGTPCSTCQSHCTGINSQSQFCPQICPGNGAFGRSDGAILVGNSIVPGCLSKPKEAFSNIYMRIRKNLERGNDITITIEEQYSVQHYYEMIKCKTFS